MYSIFLFQMMGNPSGIELPAQQAYDQFWPKATEEIQQMEISGLKHQELPLARIKKIMKLDEDVKMISAEAPVLFSKAAEMFIHELTMRAWIHTEDNKRRTLQRNDIAMAITKYDQFDFLIDIVPRDEVAMKPTTTNAKPQNATEMTPQVGTGAVRMAPDQVSYYFQVQQGANTTTAQQPQQQAQQTITTTTAAAPAVTVQPQVIQLQPQQMVNSLAPPPGGIQIVQQIVAPNGEIQQIPIQLTSQQLQMIRTQMTGGGQQQPLVIQTAPIQATSLQPTQQTQQQSQQQTGQQSVQLV